ncbi:hypothetical protein O181_049107 [Austropuccinia psidii MF-1]|uniref:Uncharacterized protein n=1 Tax=Austropuccinia psidii MF-1 TaxID=1389203 RepID=A0A9Q3DWC1_9BASI|nr:hypothetical protein [Austropuccinia psidii MF-1]
MLDSNLYTLNFVKSSNDPQKLFLIEQSTGEPIYFRLKSKQINETRLELYHAPTLASLGAFEPISSKLKLISLSNPNSIIELKPTGYLNWEWTFYFEENLKFSWKKDIVGLSSSKRGFTCWMVRKPDPDYPCAIYRPATSTTPPSCQFLDFNIRRIENLKDRRGLQTTILLSLLGFTEALADYETRKSPPHSNISSSSTSNILPKSSIKPPTTPKPTLSDDHQPIIEPNELRLSHEISTVDLLKRGLDLFKDPLFLYLYVHATTPKTFKSAVDLAERIKRDHLKNSGQELYQYLVDDIISSEISSKTHSQSLPPSNSNLKNSNSLKIYLSRTPLDELLPKAITKSAPNSSSFQSISSKKILSAPPSLPPKEFNPSTRSSSPTSNSKLWSGIQRPLTKVFSFSSSISSKTNRNSLNVINDLEKEIVTMIQGNDLSEKNFQENEKDSFKQENLKPCIMINEIKENNKSKNYLIKKISSLIYKSRQSV